MYKSKFRNLIMYMKKLVLEITDNRMRIHDPLTPSERRSLDNEYVIKNAIYRRVRVLKVNPVKPNPVFL